MVVRTGNLIPAPIRYDWTVNYDDAPYVQIPEWAVINGRVSFDVLASSLLNSNNYIFDGRTTDSTGNDRGFINYEINGDIQFHSLSNINIPINIDTGVFYNFEADYRNAFITIIGTRFSIADQHWQGQISNLRLTDLDNPANSRHYPGIINAASMPESTVLVDVLGVPVDQNLNDDFTTWISSSNVNIINSNSFNVSGNNEGIIEGFGTIGRFYRIDLDIDIPASVEVRGGNEIIGTTQPLLSTIPAGRRFFSFYFQMQTRSESVNSGIYLRTTDGTNNPGPYVFNFIRVFEVTDGIITNPDANQPYVPLLGANQHYLSGNNDATFSNGIDTTNNMMTSAAGASNLSGSWSGNQPVVGSVLSSNNGAVVEVTAVTGDDLITYSVTTGTEDQIQLGFEYPNVLTVTPPTSP